MSEKAEKSPNFEQIISQEVNNMGLDASDMGEIEASGKVSEVVRENAGENIPTSSGKGTTQDDKSNGVISDTVSGLLFKGGNGNQNYVLPTPDKQKLEVKKAIAKRTRDLVHQATKLEKSKYYSAAKMERLLKEIRHMRQLMSQLVDMTRESIEGLYRKYIWKQ
jgi:predicted aldo/keto reductase-like oxidoreductase